MSTVNRMSFDGVENAVDFIKVLHNISKNDLEWYCDIHTYYEDCNVCVVEWTQSPKDRGWGADGFKYVGEDEVIMIEKEFPDNHYEYFMSEAEYEEALKDWLLEHPTYKKNQFGHWYDSSDDFVYNFDEEELKKIETKEE